MSLFARARYYDPVTARFTQEDTYRGDAMDVRSLNLYAYCANDPVNYVDPSGHEPEVWMPPSSWAEIEGSYCGNEEDFQDYIDRSGRREEYNAYIGTAIVDEYNYAVRQAAPGEQVRFNDWLAKTDTFTQEEKDLYTIDDIAEILFNMSLSGDTRKSAEEAALNALNSDPELCAKFVIFFADQVGGVKNARDNIYQTLYDASGLPAIDEGGNKPTGPKNRYSDYDFTIFDALNWLVQTGGNINLVLQVRDVQSFKDSANNFDAWKAIEISAQKQVNIIKDFIAAKNLLSLVTSEGQVMLPRFFIGAVEQKPETLLDWGEGETFHKGIYNTVIDLMGGDDSMIAGVYYGEDYRIDVGEGAEESRRKAKEMSAYFHARGKQLLYIPYFSYDSKNEDYVNTFMNQIDETASTKVGTHPLFDTILVQPGTYFDDKKLYDDQIIPTIVGHINQWNEERGKNDTILGLQVEFDMGLVTGRSDLNYNLDRDEKIKQLNKYFDAVMGTGSGTSLKPGTPIGIYSGGINEHGYSNIYDNANEHNTGNHLVTGGGASYDYMNGTPYNKFPHAYDGNLIYDINNYLFGHGLSNKLEDYLHMK